MPDAQYAAFVRICGAISEWQRMACEMSVVSSTGRIPSYCLYFVATVVVIRHKAWKHLPYPRHRYAFSNAVSINEPKASVHNSNATESLVDETLVAVPALARVEHAALRSNFGTRNFVVGWSRNHACPPRRPHIHCFQAINGPSRSETIRTPAVRAGAVTRRDFVLLRVSGERRHDVACSLFGRPAVFPTP
jgi:hypothetical protein